MEVGVLAGLAQLVVALDGLHQRVGGQPGRLGQLLDGVGRVDDALLHALLDKLHALVGLLRVADDGEFLAAAFHERREVIELAGHRLVRATIAQVGDEHARVHHAQRAQLVVEGQRLAAHQVDLRQAALQQRHGAGLLRQLDAVAGVAGAGERVPTHGTRRVQLLRPILAVEAARSQHDGLRVDGVLGLALARLHARGLAAVHEHLDGARFHHDFHAVLLGFGDEVVHDALAAGGRQHGAVGHVVAGLLVEVAAQLHQPIHGRAAALGHEAADVHVRVAVGLIEEELRHLLGCAIVRVAQLVLLLRAAAIEVAGADGRIAAGHVVLFKHDHLGAGARGLHGRAHAGHAAAHDDEVDVLGFLLLGRGLGGGLDGVGLLGAGCARRVVGACGIGAAFGACGRRGALRRAAGEAASGHDGCRSAQSHQERAARNACGCDVLSLCAHDDPPCSTMLLVGGRPSSGRAAVAILPGNGAAPPAPKWVDCENPP